MSPEDLFSQLFGGGMFGGRGGRPSGPRRGKDMAHPLKVSLEDLYKGKVSKLALQKTVICNGCEGRGGKEGATKSCSTCNGRGVKFIMRQMGPVIQQMQQTCPDCNGEGEIIRDKDRCKVCNGRKVNQERKVWNTLLLLCLEETLEASILTLPSNLIFNNFNNADPRSPHRQRYEKRSTYYIQRRRRSSTRHCSRRHYHYSRRKRTRSFQTP